MSCTKQALNKYTCLVIMSYVELKKKNKQENYGINMRFTKDKANNENYNI